MSQVVEVGGEILKCFVLVHRKSGQVKKGAASIFMLGVRVETPDRPAQGREPEIFAHRGDDEVVTAARFRQHGAEETRS